MATLYTSYANGDIFYAGDTLAAQSGANAIAVQVNTNTTGITGAIKSRARITGSVTGATETEVVTHSIAASAISTNGTILVFWKVAVPTTAASVVLKARYAENAVNHDSTLDADTLANDVAAFMTIFQQHPITTTAIRSEGMLLRNPSGNTGVVGSTGHSTNVITQAATLSIRAAAAAGETVDIEADIWY